MTAVTHLWTLWWLLRLPDSIGKHISYSWSAGYRISTNGSYHWTEESPKEISASGSEINGTLVALDVFPDSFAGAYNAEEEIPTTLTASRRIRRSSAEKEIDEEYNEDLKISPEVKVKFYVGVILSTIFLIVFVLCIWPCFTCLRSCYRYSSTCCMSCWDLLHCRDPGYRIMCLAAKQNGLDPPSPEEYDRFMSGWESKAPELLEALLQP